MANVKVHKVQEKRTHVPCIDSVKVSALSPVTMNMPQNRIKKKKRRRETRRKERRKRNQDPLYHLASCVRNIFFLRARQENFLSLFLLGHEPDRRVKRPPLVSPTRFLSCPQGFIRKVTYFGVETPFFRKSADSFQLSIRSFE